MDASSARRATVSAATPVRATTFSVRGPSSPPERRSWWRSACWARPTRGRATKAAAWQLPAVRGSASLRGPWCVAGRACNCSPQCPPAAARLRGCRRPCRSQAKRAHAHALTRCIVHACRGRSWLPAAPWRCWCWHDPPGCQWCARRRGVCWRHDDWSSTSNAPVITQHTVFLALPLCRLTQQTSAAAAQAAAGSAGAPAPAGQHRLL